VNNVGAELSIAWGLPMAGILLSIAILPLVAKRIWEKWYGEIGVLWALAFVIPAGFQLGWGLTGTEVLHILLVDYLPFIIMIGTLFVISGGIVISGPFRGTPRSNAALLLAGTICASAVGTTGASMLFIRPLLRANKHRRHRAHTIVFFIFLVSNIGGSLTPLGDPPLFLGFLRGVGFFWTTTNLLVPTAFLSGCLLAIYLVLDTFLLGRERRQGAASSPDQARADEGPVPIRVEGAFNLILLVAVAGTILASGAFARDPLFQQEGGAARSLSLGPVHVPVLSILSSAALVAFAGISLVRTPRPIRKRNEFAWGPLEEVAILFLGIFVTMVPVLMMLRAGVQGAFGPLIERVRDPVDYFMMAGVLSAFLDNAPSYVVFFEAAHATPMAEFAARGAWGAVDPVDPLRVNMPGKILMGISAGAVFMGAMTYIGNGPNFMVKSIAEQSGVKMPTFFGYLLKWSVPTLLPLLAAVAWIFLRG
jgi:Na+/H+ antiporter NhaD/arsenite permease-like protein